MKRIVILLGITPLLSGCWFIFIPGPVIDSAADAISGGEGDHCVGHSAKVGDSISIPGIGTGTIKSLSGESYRCRNTPHFPVRAKLIF